MENPLLETGLCGQRITLGGCGPGHFMLEPHSAWCCRRLRQFSLAQSQPLRTSRLPGSEEDPGRQAQAVDVAEQVLELDSASL